MVARDVEIKNMSNKINVKTKIGYVTEPKKNATLER